MQSKIPVTLRRQLSLNVAIVRTPRRQKVAYREYNKALRKGHLVRAEHCEDCGVSGTMHGHHPDYDRPLEVCWLCPMCHVAAHESLRHRFPDPMGDYFRERIREAWRNRKHPYEDTIRAVKDA